ncbi:flagellar motor protein MotB [Sphingomonas nostoxanthinifaciens]|uniref:flagellar motor protein MotB n=1 Tax=Sphingomonas nostoxanthinifaciens TaxID=2872652 RepID=UPI001CC1CEB0|nr:flagellar motor protein MotB [Sphingomonas nostoxanthinifaciens]UAK26053.1 flagellar motor protein [Sphingomonas nostoxanthinifaciens]
MKARSNARWALSFADLCLLLLGFFVLLQAHPDPQALTQSVRAALGTPTAAPLTVPARLWFDPGEAVLRSQARASLLAYARGGGAITISSRGTEPNAARFDGWELAAARSAAVARALVASGMPAGQIALAIDPATGGGQVIRVSRRR